MKREAGSFPVGTLLFALRAMGYNFSSAVADIIDNSISARAKKVRVFSSPTADEPYFAILDDGCGMDVRELKNAMQFGSDRSGKPVNEIELGRYGLGLKSASLSQCRHFTVVTKAKKGGGVSARAFDLDIVEQADELSYDVLSDTEVKRVPHTKELLAQKHGTLVVWRDFDRMKESSSDFVRTFRSSVTDAQKHVELVFHRFYREVEILFNNIRIAERDPFLLKSHPRQQTGRTSRIPVGGDFITVTPYVLPFANSLTEAEKKLLGNKSVYDDQGFYIYRNRRLIHWGGWMRMGMRSELNKLARVCVDIPSSLDSVWSLDVKKSSARIPDSVKDSIFIAVRDSNIRSQKAVKSPGVKEASVEHKVWDRYNEREGEVTYRINRENPLLQALQASIGREENALLEAFVSQVEALIPKYRIQNDLADSVKILNTMDDAEEKGLIEDLMRCLALFPPEDRMAKLDYFLCSEAYQKVLPYRSELMRRVSNA